MQNSSVAIAWLALGLALALPARAASPDADAKVVAEATGGRFKALRGQYFDRDCNQILGYDAEVTDLNGDGQPEAFVTVQGACMGGMAGAHVDLFIKDKAGRWHSQFGFPGMHTVLETRHLGYPDIEIGGPGNCFPVWRWNGRAYALHKKCPR